MMCIVRTACSSPTADIVFVLDGSGSIGAANFANVRTFVNQVVESFDVSQQKVRIGLIEFSQTAAVQFNLTTYDTAAQVENAVTNTPYFTGGLIYILFQTFFNDYYQLTLGPTFW